MIYFFFETFFQLSQKKPLKKWIRELINEESAYEGEINFIFCNDKYLLDINRSYLKHDFYTDVVTFDYVKEKVISGDIFISIDRIKENAVEWRKSFKSELFRVMAHGVLHLLGYEDKIFEKEKIMRKREDFYLNLLSQKFKCFT